MKHRFSSWFITVVALLLFGVYYLTAFPNEPGSYGFKVNYQTIFISIGIVVNSILLVLVYITRSKHTASKWYALMSAAFIIGLFATLMNALSLQPEVGLYWERLQYPAWILGVIGFLMFCHTYATDEESVEHLPLFITLLIFSGFTPYLFAASDAIGYLHIEEWQHTVVGYEVTKLSSDVSYLSLLFLITLIIVGCLIMFRYSRIVQNAIIKRQVRVFNLAFLQLAAFVPIDLAYSAGLVRTIMGNDIPALAPFYMSNIGILVGYGVLKYGIFKINPSTLSGTILANLAEAVVATNDNFIIEFTNNSVEQVTGYSQDKLKGEHISVLFNTDRFKIVTDGVTKSIANFSIEDTEIKNNLGEPVPVALSVGRVKTAEKKQEGYIFVFANITELKKKTVELAREKASVEQKVVERTKELSEEHARLTASINSLNIGFIMTGQADSILTMNMTAQSILERLAEAQHIKLPEVWSLHDIVNVCKAGADLHIPIQNSKDTKRSVEFNEL